VIVVPHRVQGLPDALLERGAARGEVQVEGGQLAREVRLELPRDAGESGGVSPPAGLRRGVAIAGHRQ